MVAAIVAASFLVFPGYPIALLTGARGAPRSVLLESMVWSVFFCSAVFWVPPLHGLALDTWFFICLAASAAGAVFAGITVFFYLRERRFRRPSAERIPILLAIALTGGFMLVNFIVRPVIDWDAVNYYLFVAVGFSTANHVGMTLPSSIIFAPHTPNGITPLLPTIYALAIKAAAFFHTTAELSVHLIPAMFFAGTIVATRRIATRFMPAIAADAAGLFVAVMPAMIAYYVGNPLFVDAATTFLLTVLAYELYHYGSDAAQGGRLGALLSLLVLSKANGFALIALVLIVAFSVRAGKTGGRAIAATAALGMTAAAGALHLYDGVESPWLWVAIVLVVCGCVVFVHPLQVRLRALVTEQPLTLLFALPGIYYMYALSKAVGSPMSFFVPSLLHVPSPNYKWALAALATIQLYPRSPQPGLPENYGLGLILWWGFSPFINAAAFAGGAYAYTRMPKLRPVVLLVLFFYLAWLTLFNLTSFRHLLPALPLLAVLAAFGIGSLLRTRRAAIVWATLGIALASVPFAWSAQMAIYSAPERWLDTLSIDQFHALSAAGLLWSGIYFVTVCGLGVLTALTLSSPAVRPAWPRIAIFALLLAALPCALSGATLLAGAAVVVAAVIALVAWSWRARWSEHRRFMVWACATSIIVVSLTFEPLLASAVSPGLAAQAASVRDNEDFRYVPALTAAMNAGPGSGSILTYKGYGVSWFSSGKYRRIDLTDAFDLGVLRPVLQSRDAERFMKTLEAAGTFAALLPAHRFAAIDTSYQRLITSVKSPALIAFDDPLLTLSIYQNPYWRAIRLFDLSTGHGAARLQSGSQTGKDSIVIRIPGSDRNGTVTVFAVGQTIRSKNIAGEPANITFTRNVSAGVFTVSPRELAGTVNQRNVRADAVRAIAIRAVQYRSRQGAVYDWRSPRFALLERSGSWYPDPQNVRFYLRPETAPIASVEVRGAALRSPSALALYPGRIRTDLTWTAQVLAVGIRSSSLCRSGAPMLVTVTGSGKTVRSTVPAGGQFIAPLGTLFKNGTSTVQLRAISARGTGARCRVAETLVAPSLQLTRRTSHYTVAPGFEALHIAQLDVP